MTVVDPSISAAAKFVAHAPTPEQAIKIAAVARVYVKAGYDPVSAENLATRDVAEEKRWIECPEVWDEERRLAEEAKAAASGQMLLFTGGAAA